MNFSRLVQFSVLFFMQTCLVMENTELALAVDVIGMKVNEVKVGDAKVRFVNYQGPATLSVEATAKYRLQIDIVPRSEQKPLTIGVQLPISGKNTWPVADVEVLNSKGQAIAVRRSGIEWHKLQFTVPAEPGRYVVHVVEPDDGPRRPLPEKVRYVEEPTTGLRATICKWFHGRRAALSIRFDDSHPTHLSVAIPLLRKYGFRGTFMVNPGGQLPNSRRHSAFEEHRAEWQACAKRGDQEFANHTMHHCGATNDEAMELEVGDASKVLWKLFPGKSKLIALNLGGGTKWETTKTLRYYLDKYHLFDASANSTGMDDSYGNRVDTFRRLLEKHIERGLWYKVHYHYIGKGLSSSEANFRAALDIAKKHEPELWIAGMADIYKYQTERAQAKLVVETKSPKQIALTLKCSTDPKLYDQHLTIEIGLPSGWSPEKVVVKLAKSGVLIPTVVIGKERTIRFDVAPITATYLIER